MKKGDPRGPPSLQSAARAALYHQNVYLAASVTTRPIWLW